MSLQMPKLIRVSRPTQTFISFSILSLAYILLTAFLPPVTATLKQYHLSINEYRVLTLLVAFPLVGVWFAAFYGYARVEQYSHTIRNTPDGQAFEKIGKGLRWLAWGLPVGSIVGSILGGIAHDYASLGTTAVVITHYVSLVISLVAFWVISSGTRDLTQVADKHLSLRAIRGLSSSFIFLGVTYTYITIRTVQAQATDPYRLPMWLILLTIIMPYLYAWLMGFLASYEISLYRKHVRGVFYKRALNLLSGGMSLVILSSVILQYLTSSSPYLRRITLDWVFLVVYIILAVYAAGFILITVGASKLKRIEEV
jgi:hypothetical protein